MKGNLQLTLKEMAALQWASGALTTYIIDRYGTDKATKSQARNATAVIRRLYMPSFKAWIKDQGART